MKTSRVQVICRKCNHPYLTGVRGGNSRCPRCATSRYVRVGQQWEGPVTPDRVGYAARAEQVSARLPVWCECRCGHEWQSRARDRATVRCPSCRTNIRVPHRDHSNTQTTPRGPLPLAPAPRSSPRRPAAPESPRPRPTLAPAAPGLGSLLSGLFRGPAMPAEPAPVQQLAPAPAPFAPRSAPAARPAPHVPTPDRGRDRRRRDTVCSLVRSLGGHLLVWYDTDPGACEVMDTSLRREEQRCPAAAARAVTFSDGVQQDATAYACMRHAGPLAVMADRTPAYQAVVSLLR